MNDFVGRKTKDQIEMIKAIVTLSGKNKVAFSAQDISKLCGVDTKKFAGAFMALANPCGDFPALISRAGREKIEMTNGTRRYIQLWKINSEFKENHWQPLIETLKGY